MTKRLPEGPSTEAPAAVDLLGQQRLIGQSQPTILSQEVSDQMSQRAQDPRHKNVTMDASSVGSYARDYAAALRTAIESIDAGAIEQVCAQVLDASGKGNQIL